MKNFWKNMKNLINLCNGYGRVNLSEVNKPIIKAYSKLNARQKNLAKNFITEKWIDYIEHILRCRYWEKKSTIKEEQKKEVSKTSLAECLYLINKTFLINKNVKKNAYEVDEYPCDCNGFCDKCEGLWYYTYTTVDYDLRNSEYSKKTAYLKTIISMIKANRLPIKYGCNDDVLYFEYLWKQVSFHTLWKIKCKKFDWVWSEIPNKKQPFYWKVVAI